MMDDENAKKLIESVDSLYNAIENLRDQVSNLERSVDAVSANMPECSLEIIDDLLVHSCVVEKVKEKGGIDKVTKEGIKEIKRDCRQKMSW